jgi:hypothetical protein
MEKHNEIYRTAHNRSVCAAPAVRTVILRMIILIYVINNQKNQSNHTKITVLTESKKSIKSR